MSRPSVIVARDDVFAQAAAVLTGVRRGVGATLVIEGPAGIGKTTVAQHVVDVAARSGFNVRVAAANELERDLPLVPFVDALGLDPAAEDALRAELAALLRGEGAVDPTQRRWRLTTGIADLLETEVAEGPLLLVVEDAHWLDSDSAVALSRLVALQETIPLALLVTARPDPRTAHVSALWRRLLDSGAVLAELEPLDEDAVERLAQETVGDIPGPELLSSLARAGGNPLHVTEMLEAFRDTGALQVEDGVVRLTDDGLPPSLRLTIVRRLGALPEPTVEVLRHAAILGNAAPLAHVAAACGASVTSVIAALEPAYRAGLLEGDDRLVRFRHDLIRDALYDDVPASSRAVLHGEAATVLRDAGAPAQQIAVHLSRGLGPTDEAAVGGLLDVAGQVLDAAPELAASMAARAVEAGTATSSQRVRARILRVQAALLLGRPDEAESLLGELEADELSDAERLDLWRALTVARDTRRGVDAPPLDEYLGLVRQSKLSEEQRLWHLAVIAAVGAAVDPVRSRELIDDALPVADDGHPETAVLVRTAAARSCMFLGDLDEALEHSDRAVELARSSQRELSWAGVEAVSTYCFLRSIDPAKYDAVVGLATEALSAAESAGLGYALPRLHGELVRVSFFGGRHDQMLTHCETLTRLAAETGFDDMVSLAESMAARVELLRGLDDRASERLGRLRENAAEVEAGGVHIERDLDVTETEVPFDQARLLLISGDAGGAYEAARPAIQRTASMGESRFVYSIWTLPYLEAAIATGRADDAREWAVTLEEFAVHGPPLGVLSRLARVATKGSAEEARAVVSALDEVAAFPLRFDGYAIVGRVLVEAGDEAGAIDAFQRGRAVADDAGASVLVGWYDARLRQLGVRRGAAEGPRRPDTGWEALTEAEWRVVDLVAEGLVYREVGERLFIGRRTVETHVASVFRKLGMRSRNELTRAYLEREAPAP